MKPIAAMMAINLRMVCVLVVLIGNSGANVSGARLCARMRLPFTACHELQNSS
jgi:hypothetical protein